ncbi:MAG: hypothetical protein H0T89_32205 [Deltaproteobacteria bacterium]|nr:hypothetical protein [Deltaproteobacteria bacterium]MDQ3296993.1 hypothetical protein [Myxococcota bacterium]
MRAAFAELARLGCGIQLTPGNLPTAGFREHVAISGVPTRTHHGFSYEARKTATWSEGTCVVASDSLHPPKLTDHANGNWRAWVESTPAPPILEVMYPGYALGTGDEVERAMADGIALAVDVSHVYLQIMQGAMTEQVWRRLRDYQRIAEVHVSANRGRADTHQPLAADTFGLDWARERVANDDVVILESYMHRTSDVQREAQVSLLRGAPGE